LFIFIGYAYYKDVSSKVIFSSDGKSDYEAVRSTFKTTLTKTGPAPQEYEDIKITDDAEEITYKSGELELKAWVSKYIDKSKKNPAVVYVHGDFTFREDNWDQTKEFMNLGFVVMTPMLRGENGNPGCFEFLHGEVDDIIAAGEYLANQPYIDKKIFFLQVIV